MTTAEVAHKLVELCREGKIDEVQATLFDETAKSIEANEMMGPRVTEGLDGIKQKAVAFQQTVEEAYSTTISEPVVAGNSFAVSWSMDAAFKGKGRMTIQEVCVYQVKGGKIILEQFFY